MRILLINSVCGIRSTGRICTDLAERLSAEGHEVRIAYGRAHVPARYEKYAIRIGTETDVKLHGLQTRLLDTHGFGSQKATRRFLQWADEFDPALLWLHNLHGYYINVEALFAWIKTRPQMVVKWTLHDCWAFTGHCSYFDAVHCVQWESHCQRCVQKNEYPASYVCDNCRNNFMRKKAAFTGVQNMTILTPSQWLAGLVQRSFLGGYPVEVHNNTIDTKVFKPTPGTFRTKHGLMDKRIILGVASSWDARKGLHDFIRLSALLEEPYVIVLVGLTKKQIGQMPGKIVAIQRTENPEELAEIYSAADVFFNPTYEDTYPTVNLEAEACGTPVVTYRTGGAPETIRLAHSCVVEAGALQEAACILRIISGGKS